MTNDKDGAALLPCPFCGAEAPHVFPANTFVECQECGGLGPDGTNEAESIAAWNRRAALQSHGQAFDAAGVREACAKVVDSFSSKDAKIHWSQVCDALSAAIRALPIPEAPASVEPVAKVPAFATEEMVEAGLKTGSRYGATAMRNIWREMYMAAQSAHPEPDTIGSHFGNGGGLDPVRACGCPECEASPGFGGGDLREAVAVALWKREAERAAPNVAKGRNAVTFHDQLECEKGKWLGLADAALAALPPVKQSVGKFQRGDHVEKVSGSNWRGKVVGEYSTDLTPEGYAVESDTETGSVQIYPAKALRLSHDQRGGSGE